MELEYDRFGRLIAWKWDDLTEQYAYDRSGRLFKIDYTDGTSLTHTFKDLIDNLVRFMPTLFIRFHLLSLPFILPICSFHPL